MIGKIQGKIQGEVCNCFSEMIVVMEAAMESKMNIHGEYKSEADSAIFQFQTIEVEGIMLNLLFGYGCGEMVVNKSTITKLLVRRNR